MPSASETRGWRKSPTTSRTRESSLRASDAAILIDVTVFPSPLEELETIATSGFFGPCQIFVRMIRYCSAAAWCSPSNGKIGDEADAFRRTTRFACCRDDAGRIGHTDSFALSNNSVTSLLSA